MTPTLDTLLPTPTYRISASRFIRAPAPIVWREVMTLPMSALPRGFTLTLLRHVPDVVSGAEKRVRGSDTFLDATPIPVLVAVEPRLIISAGVSQAWKLHPTPAPLLDAVEFADWTEPGWIKVAMSFELTETPHGRGTLLSTETRVIPTDPGAARDFAPYWWAIKAGSALIRREVLTQVGRRAESREPT